MKIHAASTPLDFATAARAASAAARSFTIHSYCGVPAARGASHEAATNTLPRRERTRLELLDTVVRDVVGREDEKVQVAILEAVVAVAWEVKA